MVDKKWNERGEIDQPLPKAYTKPTCKHTARGVVAGLESSSICLKCGQVLLGLYPTRP